MTDRWNDVAHRMVRIEMVRKGLTYADLTERLRPLGVDDNERNIRNKVARGTFSGVFLIQCLAALGVRTVDLMAYDLPVDLSAPGSEEILQKIRSDQR